MKITKSVMIPQDRLTDVVCDKCDKSTHASAYSNSNPKIFEYASLSADWGYDSGQDGTGYDFQICESCFNEIISTFIRNKPAHECL